MTHENNMVCIYPRRKAGEKDAGTPARGRPAIQLGYSAVAALFDMTQAEAAHRLGISITALRSLQTRRCAPCHRNRGDAFLKGEMRF